MIKSDSITIADVTVKVNTSLTILESLRSKRVIVDNLVKETRTAIDERSKEIKKELSIQLKRLDLTSSLELCNALSKSPRGADDALRQRFQRRRNWLLNELRSLYPAYDITSDRGILRAELVGDAETREAKEIFATLKELQEMGITPGMTVAQIKGKLRKTVAPLESVDDGMESAAAMVEAITGKPVTTQGGQTAGQVVETPVETPVEKTGTDN
jgi:hypothetical protein